MDKKEFPILEFDNVSEPIVNAKKYVPDFINEKSDKCLITYFSDVVDSLERVFRVNQAFKIRTEGVRPRVFYMKINGQIIYVVPMPVGAPQAARMMEVMAAIGVKKFIICGGAGSLNEEMTSGKILVPTAAVRDEGTSYHYLPPSREVEINPVVLKTIEGVLTSEKEPFVRVKTWTTDGIFRETKNRVAIRKEEGCHTVEMECATFYSVAWHKNLLCGQLLYAGDLVDIGGWQYRDWHTASEAREKLFDLSVKCLMKM